MTALVAVLAVAAASAAALAWRAHRAASAAQHARGHYELVAANLPDVSVLLYDRELRFTTLEGSALGAHGWRRDQIEGRPIEDVIPADRVDDLVARCRAALAGEPSSQDWPGLRDGARYLLQHLPVRDPRGAVTGGMIVVREVGEQLRLQERVEAQSGFLAGVLEQLSDFVVACDADGRLQRFGEAPAADVDPLDWPAHFGLRRADGTTPRRRPRSRCSARSRARKWSTRSSWPRGRAASSPPRDRCATPPGG